ncbi:hypothetical protein FBULB1_14187 [Fusarium bulbicola]|nr:hypothetical protein FBULB1_14187 [Fusarium bulbicola]
MPTPLFFTLYINADERSKNLRDGARNNRPVQQTSYVCSLYGAMLAQCNDDLSTAPAAPSLRTDTFSPIPDAFTDYHGHDSGASFSALGLDRLIDFLRYDMAMPEERYALYKHLKHAWEFEKPSGSESWDESFWSLLKTKPRYKNGDESPMFRQLSLRPGEKLRYRVGQQRAWVFFDDDRFYPQESPERPNIPICQALGDHFARKCQKWKR